MRAVKGGIAEKLGLTFSPNKTTMRLGARNFLGLLMPTKNEDWTQVLINPGKYTKGRLF